MLKFISIPENINPEGFGRLYRERYMYILHKIQQETFNQNANHSDFICLNAQILKQLLGNKYKTLLTDLVTDEIIEINHSYLAGERSKGFRLTERYRTGFKNIPMTESKLNRKIHVFGDTLQAMERKELKWLEPSLSKLEFDYNGAIQYLNANYSQYEYSPETCQVEKNDKYFSRLDAINKFNENPSRLLTNNNLSKRVFTTVAMLPRDIRHFVTIAGHKAVNVDVSNSQPFHFLPFLNDYCLKYSNEGIKPDVKKFNTLVLNNKLYSEVINDLGYTGDKVSFKVDFFKHIFYSNHRAYYKHYARDYFMTEFPTVYKAINYNKEHLNGHYTKPNERFKNFPIALQIEERKNVVDNIVKALVSQYPNECFIPIHDSIFCAEHNANLVSEQMKQVFVNQYGNYPAIKTEYV